MIVTCYKEYFTKLENNNFLTVFTFWVGWENLFINCPKDIENSSTTKQMSIFNRDFERLVISWSTDYSYPCANDKLQTSTLTVRILFVANTAGKVFKPSV